MIDKSNLLNYNYKPNNSNMQLIRNHFYINAMYISNKEDYDKFDYNIKNVLLKLFHAKAYNKFNYEDLLFIITEYTDYNNWKAELCIDRNNFTTDNNYNIIVQNKSISFNN